MGVVSGWPCAVIVLIITALPPLAPPRTPPAPSPGRPITPGGPRERVRDSRGDFRTSFLGKKIFVSAREMAAGRRKIDGGRFLGNRN